MNVLELEEGWVYLAVFMDLFSRQIIGWSIDDQMTVDLVRDAFNMAVSRRKIEPGLIVHSDRGVQYRAWEYQQVLEAHECCPEHEPQGKLLGQRRHGNIFSRIKVELVYAEEYATLGDACGSIFEYIEVSCNRVRRHSAIGYKSPNEYEQQFARCA